LKDQVLVLPESVVGQLRSLKSPSKLKELQSILGFFQFYQCLSHNSKIYIKPLLDMVKKDVAWRWTSVEEKGLRGAIEALVHSHLKGFTKLLYNLPKSLLICYSDWSKLTNSSNVFVALGIC
jgi:hypothetical protein